MELKGSRTEQNLRDAFSGESQAFNKYTFFARQADREGYQQIAAIFLETAENEKAHASRWFNFLGDVHNTAKNLQSAAMGENYEHSVMYRDFEQVAREEGFTQIADAFKHVGEVEAEHEKRYLALMANIQEGRVFQRPQTVAWQCRNCGYIYMGTEAPKSCPACAHPQSFFQLKMENY